MDKENLSEVKQMCEKIYTGNGERPKRVTAFAVTRAMGWPDKRLDYLPKCKKIVLEYYEDIEAYWARESVWAYNLLQKNGVDVHWKQLRDIMNLSRNNFERAKQFLGNYTDADIAEKIRELI